MFVKQRRNFNGHMLLVSLMLASEYMNQNPFDKLEVLKFSDGQEANQRQKRSSSPDGSQQTPTLTASEVQVLIKQELSLLQNQVCAKNRTLFRSEPKGKKGRRGRQGIQGKPGPPGRPAQTGHPGINMDQ